MATKCAAGQCSEHVTDRVHHGHFCNACWGRLPTDLQTRVMRDRRVSRALELKAVANATQWLRTNSE